MGKEQILRDKREALHAGGGAERIDKQHHSPLASAFRFYSTKTAFKK